jgi:hypothetical protein
MGSYRCRRLGFYRLLHSFHRGHRDVELVMQAGSWKSTRLPIRYGENVMVACGGIACCGAAYMCATVKILAIGKPWQGFLRFKRNRAFQA